VGDWGLRTLFRDLRTEGAGRGREAAALGVGAFIGCLPFYGFHLLLVAGVGWLLRLNRLRMYAAANISNPLMAPALIFAEIQTGAWLRRRDFHDLTIDAIRNTDPWTFGGDLLLGSVVVGAVLGTLIVAATLAAVSHAPPLPAHVEAAMAAAADRYFAESITAWEFARGKLRRDPIYRATLDGALPGGGTLVDIGCGQGLTLAVLAEARRAARAGAWPGVAPPMFARMIGIESRPRVAAMARRALGDDAEVVHAFAPEGLPADASAAVLFDVLHLIEPRTQHALMRAVFARLAPGGVVLVREVDAAAGRGFEAVKFGNRLKNLAVGNWRQTFHFRTQTAWRELFAAGGWQVETRPMGEGTPFANVLFRLVKPEPPDR
jgi:predicted methyltransferase